MNRQEALENVRWGYGVQAEKGNRWFKVYPTSEPGGLPIILEAGYDMMPADYREEHDTPEDALDSLEESVPMSEWSGGYE